MIYLLRTFYFGDTIDTCRLTPFHGIITFFSSVIFIQFWAREENKKAYSWGTSSRQQVDRGISTFTYRHEFRGNLRKSEVTGRVEKYYPANIRRLKYILSGLVTLVLLAVAFLAMILSLNAQGFIKPQQKVLLTISEEEEERFHFLDHPFYFAHVASLAERGGMFDSNSIFRSYIPVILHVILVNLMNSTYRKISAKLTDFESKSNEIQ